jgi:hypothetical protein
VSPTQQCGDYNPCVLNWNQCSQLGILWEGQTKIDPPWCWRVKLSRPDQKSAIQCTWIPKTRNSNCVTLQRCNSFVYCLTPLRTWNHSVPSRDNTLLFSSLLFKCLTDPQLLPISIFTLVVFACPAGTFVLHVLQLLTSRAFKKHAWYWQVA